MPVLLKILHLNTLAYTTWVTSIEPKGSSERQGPGLYRYDRGTAEGLISKVWSRRVLQRQDRKKQPGSRGCSSLLGRRPRCSGVWDRCYMFHCGVTVNCPVIT